LRLCSVELVLQASILDCEAFDPFSFPQDFWRTSEVDIGWCEIVQAFVVTAVIIVVDEAADFGLKLAWKIVVFQRDAVLQRLMPALDFALCLWMAECAADMRDFVIAELFCEIALDVGRAVV
jgi:hypothetical protein